MASRVASTRDARRSSAAGSRFSRQRRSAQWWKGVDGECPISLVPVREMERPPFILISTSSSNVRHYFDAKLLAEFVLSSAAFINPVNRQPLEREDCEALDSHLRRHHGSAPQPSVTDCFDLFVKNCGVNTRGAEREATAVLQHLFNYPTARRSDARGHAIAYADASLTVVDEDDVVTAGRRPARGGGTVDLSSEAFPSLGDANSTAPRRGNMRAAADAPRRRLPAARSTNSTGDRETEGRTSSPPSPTQNGPTNTRVQLSTEVTPGVDQPSGANSAGEVLTSSPTKDLGLDFVQPLPGWELAAGTWELAAGTRPERCDALIEEEIETLKSIYGEDEVKFTRSFNEQGASCWEVHVSFFDWHLHLLIPSGLPYPYACPLVCVRHEEKRFGAQQTECILAALRSAAKQDGGEPFMFSLVEALRNADVM